MGNINWAAFRLPVYSIAAGILGAAAAAGFITADESEAIAEQFDSILNAVGSLLFILAAGNTHPEDHKPAKGKDVGLPVYDGPSSAVPAPEPYVGRHRSDG